MTEPCPKLSVLLPTFNSESVIRDCLESVKWADEILVVDSFSTDHTLDICREYGARILQHEYVNSAKQKNWAIPQCAHEWVLQVDTDERLEPGLQEEILAAIAGAPSEVHAFRVARKNFVFGAWVRMAALYPDWQTRLFRRERGRFEDKEVHAHIQVPGTKPALEHDLIHYGMPNMMKQLVNLDRYTRYQSLELQKRGKRFHWYHLGVRSLAIFGYYYFWMRGFRAGYRGLFISAYQATFDFWAHAKLWELQEHAGLTR
jgi:glycosyltransferase involved in cell wall biosynthesis